MRANCKKFIDHGWKIFRLDPPSTNSFKWIFVVLPYGHTAFAEFSILQASWQPYDNYTKGKVIQSLKIEACAYPLCGDDLTNDVVLWKDIDDVRAEYGIEEK